MKKFIMLLAVLLLPSAQNIKAQSHYSVWHPAKAVMYVGEQSFSSNVDVILNSSDSLVTLNVRNGSDESKVEFDVEKINEASPDKTVYLLEHKSTMTMFCTDDGTVCKMVVRLPDDSPYDKIVFLFYM